MIQPRLLTLILLGLLSTTLLTSFFSPLEDEEEELVLDRDWLELFDWRSLGPASMGGRCVAIAVSQQHPNTYWVATASGGLLKTTNAGMTYAHQFDGESSVSIGHVAVAPSDDQILWVGTGEANPRNSVSYGDGVYKSEDGGETWKRMGLEESFQIGRIAIHPEDADTVYVGAMGRLYGPNEERGLYKTTDGGKNWEKLLYVDEKTGVIDIDMHPNEPDTLIVATYERQRDGFDTNTPDKSWGPGGGIYRTRDGGQTWIELTNGLPTVELGRVGIDYSLQDPNVVYAVIESERIGRLPDDVAFMGMSGEDADVGARITRVTTGGPADKAGFKEQDIVLAVGDERIIGYQDLLLAIRMYKAGEEVQVELLRERELVEVDIEFDSYEEDSSGLSPFASFLGGQRENVQEEQVPDGQETGGIYKSIDGGDNWEKVNSLNPRPMYYSQIRVDPTDEQRIYVLGTSFWFSDDGGASFERGRFGSGVHVDHHALWIDPSDGDHMILGNDGGIYVSHDRTANWDHHNHMAIGQFYHVTADQGELYKVYGGLQDNGSWGGPNRTRGRSGTVNSDWFNIGGGDGFVCRVDPNDIDQIYSESQGGVIGWRNLRTGERGSARAGGGYRFNWETPFLLSPHNSRVLYSAGNHVFRSLDRGGDAERISPEITLTDKGSATALAESYQDPGVLWVGTDDGALWVTRDGGDNWIDLRQPAPASGVLDPGERRETVLVSLLESLDVDGDGVFTRAEVPDELVELFTGTDTDGDDTLSAYEIALFTGVPPAEEPDPLDGLWEVVVEGDGVLPTGNKFKITLETKAEGRRAGSLKSKEEKGRLRKLEYEDAERTFTFRYKAAEAEMEFKGTVGEEVITGEITIADTEFKAAFEAQREPPKQKKPKKPKKQGPGFAEVMPTPMWITGLEASRHERGRIYVAVDGHRSDDDAPHAFVSEDGGGSWRSLTDDLPRGSVRCLREDRVNEDLLYLGTEFNAWISIDRGLNWTKVSGLPTVAIHEIAQAPATDEIVAGTHGRSLWAYDVSALRQLTREALEAPAALLAPAPVTRWRPLPTRATSGIRRFVGENPASGAQICYHLAERAKAVELAILGAGGEVLYSFEEPEKKSGMHRVDWNLRRSGRSSGESSQGRRRSRGGRSIPNGTYQVLLKVDGLSYTQPLVIRGDPDYPEIPSQREEEEEQEESEYDMEEYSGDR